MMPGQGKAVERPYTSEERAALGNSAATLHNGTFCQWRGEIRTEGGANGKLAGRKGPVYTMGPPSCGKLPFSAPSQRA